jgi:hypothetical protein
MLLLPACCCEWCSLGKMSPVREHSKTCGCKWKLYKQLFVSVVLLVSVDIAFVRGREVLFLRGS